MADTEFQEFPKWKYSGNESKMVRDADEEEELGDGWGDVPGYVKPGVDSAKSEGQDPKPND